MRKRVKALIIIAMLPLLLSGCIISPWYYDDGPGYHHDHGRWHDRGYDDRGYGRR
ncbi:hypothetical protein GEOBRER4_n4037 [Citrifermentans bremense]|uniref:Lipoprotein n=1 Tax=Citrifermentans bremense TaxID=60035 RepID=A0A7R7IYW4_9BACT|nr:hypothetical protein [Citrifermentans bremense]BCO11639.1 hypothetical protein GEOBRER4_n4037 [Citrifermentans bremense]